MYSQPVMTRITSFEYLNRQLVWQEVSELLLFVLPLLDVARTRGALSRLLPRLPDPRRFLGGYKSSNSAAASTSKGPASKVHAQQGSTSGGDNSDKTAVQTRPAGPCPLCGSTDMLVPVMAVPCGHCFCYYCLASHTAADRHYTCPLDSMRVAAMERWRPGLVATSIDQ